jgi:hypothetical protein
MINIGSSIGDSFSRSPSKLVVLGLRPLGKSTSFSVYLRFNRLGFESFGESHAGQLNLLSCALFVRCFAFVTDAGGARGISLIAAAGDGIRAKEEEKRRGRREIHLSFLPVSQC